MTAPQKVALRRGLQAHQRFAASEDLSQAARIGRCFLDYYRAVPSVCWAIKRWPLLSGVMRNVLRPMVWFAIRFADAEGACLGD